MGVGGAAAEIVEEADCGWRFEPGNANELVALINRLKNDSASLIEKGENGRRHAEQFYDREKLAAKYLREILEPIVARKGSKR